MVPAAGWYLETRPSWLDQCDPAFASWRLCAWVRGVQPPAVNENGILWFCCPPPPGLAWAYRLLDRLSTFFFPKLHSLGHLSGMTTEGTWYKGFQGIEKTTVVEVYCLCHLNVTYRLNNSCISTHKYQKTGGFSWGNVTCLFTIFPVHHLCCVIWLCKPLGFVSFP